MRTAAIWSLAVLSVLSVLGCARPDDPSDELLAARYYLGGTTGLTPAQVERAKAELNRQDQEKQSLAATPSPSTSPTVSGSAVAKSEFPAPPPDQKSDCDDPNSAFAQWINSVQAKAEAGGSCLNSKGVYLINSQGARKSRYCAQFYTGSQRQESLDQAAAYDDTARQAQSTAAGTCG